MSGAYAELGFLSYTVSLPPLHTVGFARRATRVCPMLRPRTSWRRLGGGVSWSRVAQPGSELTGELRAKCTISTEARYRAEGHGERFPRSPAYSGGTPPSWTDAA